MYITAVLYIKIVKLIKKCVIYVAITHKIKFSIQFKLNLNMQFSFNNI